MKARIFGLLFALPFFGVGVWMGYSISSNLIDAAQMKQWVQVEATLTAGGYTTDSTDDSDTYEAYAEYRYSYGGQYHTNTRVSISGGGDNIGSFQKRLGRRLSSAYSQGGSIVVYVNPENPEQAVVDRSLRWGLIGFKSIFLFVFGGIGLGLMIAVFRAPKEKDLTKPEYREKPWLVNDKWNSAAVLSSSKSSMYFAWGFAALWNLISAPLPFVVYREVLEKENTLALVGLLFPVVGVGLLVWAVGRTLEWNRFGAAPVTLDPFPGAIGGQVGGTIDVNTPFDSNLKFSLTLTCLHSYMSGSGKDRSRSESPKWQDTQVAHATTSAKGTRLSFRFDVPEGESPSDADQTEDSYYLWRLNLSSRMPGTDLDRGYEIPVYATGERSSTLANFSIKEARTEQKQIDMEIVRKITRFSQGIEGKSMLYPMGRNLYSGIVGLFFGGVFAGAGWLLYTQAKSVFMGGVFGLVGSLIVVSSFYFLLNSLQILQQAGNLRTTRRILGIPVKRREMRRADFVRFNKKSSMSTQSGSRHVMHYSVYAIDRKGQKLIIGEGFRSTSQADAAAELIARELGLTPEPGPIETESRLGKFNMLTAN